jgi:phage shock protein PspC (stress-responsive transcriptional regulator)
MNRRLYRSRTDRIVAGVAGGMAEAWDLDPSIVRIGWVLLALLSFGVFLVIYIVMAVIVPIRPSDMQPPPPGQPQAGWGPNQPPRSARSRPDNTGAAIFGLILIVLGIWFLVREYLDVDVGQLWPFLVIAIGLVLIALAFIRADRR